MNLKKLLVATIVVMLIGSAIPFSAMAVHEDEDAMWIEPESISFDTATVSPGERFNITVYINALSASYSWQVKLWYDTTWLDALRADYTGVGKSEFFAGLSTMPVSPVIDDGAGYVLHGETLVGNIQRDPGSGSLFWVEFEVTEAPPKGGELSALIEFDTEQSYYQTPTLEKIFPNYYPCSVTYTWTAPPKPTLAVDPDYVEFPEYANAVGQEFTVDLMIEALSEAWYLVNASLTLSFDDTLIELIDVEFDPLWTSTSYDLVGGDLAISVSDPSTTPSGDVRIATLTFNVTHQEVSPPAPAGYYDETPLDIHDYELWDHTIQIEALEHDGLVRIYAFVVLAAPHLEVESKTVLGKVGTRFTVEVSVVDLEEGWFWIGCGLRIKYDPTYIKPISISEGPFFQEFAALQPGSMGTLFEGFIETPETDPIYGYNMPIMGMILPNSTGWWNAPWPQGSGVIAIIECEVAKTIFETTDTLLPIIYQEAEGVDTPETQNIVSKPLDAPVDGVITLTLRYGRYIDIFTEHPSGFNGYGLEEPSDMFLPQEEVTLYAEVLYNDWPVQHKLVGFEVIDNNGNTWLKGQAFTDENGIATYSFRLPWPCENPEDLFGEWTAIATVEIAEEVVSDYVNFKYDYLVHITKVTTDKTEYAHGETVTVSFEFTSKAMQEYPVLFSIVLYDELNVPVAIMTWQGTVSGAQYCQDKPYSGTVTLEIPKWAYAGYATFKVNCFDKQPEEDGTPWCPEYVGPTITILPE